MTPRRRELLTLRKLASAAEDVIKTTVIYLHRPDMAEFRRLLDLWKKQRRK